MTLIDLEGETRTYKYEIRPREDGMFSWEVHVWTSDGHLINGWPWTSLAQTLIGARLDVGKALRQYERHQRRRVIKGTITRRVK